MLKVCACLQNYDILQGFNDGSILGDKHCIAFSSLFCVLLLTWELMQLKEGVVAMQGL